MSCSHVHVNGTFSEAVHFSITEFKLLTVCFRSPRRGGSQPMRYAFHWAGLGWAGLKIIFVLKSSGHWNVCNASYICFSALVSCIVCSGVVFLAMHVLTVNMPQVVLYQHIRSWHQLPVELWNHVLFKMGVPHFKSWQDKSKLMPRTPTTKYCVTKRGWGTK